MKCLSCDVVLTDSEAVQRAPSGFFIDLCGKCRKNTVLPPAENETHEEVVDEELERIDVEVTFGDIDYFMEEEVDE